MNTNIAKDRKIVRLLAQKYYDIANSAENAEKVALYKGVNDKKMIRPVVLVDELPWQELNIDGKLDCFCEDASLRGLEWFFRAELLKHEYFGCDMYFIPYFRVYKHVTFSGIGLGSKEKILRTGNAAIVSHQYEDLLQTEDDIEKLKFETVAYNKEATMKNHEFISDIFGDIMPVKITGHPTGYGIGFAIWDRISVLKGAERLFEDLADRPEFMHKIANKLTDIFINTIRQCDELGVFGTGQEYNHCSTAFTDDLPPVNDPDNITSKNMWGRGLAQIFGSVSPAMHDEFDIQYAKKALEPFGLIYYGCCEPLDNKIDILRQIKNLRKISITPWADINRAAEVCGREFVIASKPNPANVGAGFAPDTIRSEIKSILRAVKKNNCSCDLVLKDVSTINNKPSNLIEWAKIAMTEAISF